MLSDREIDILRESMTLLRERKHLATEIFYERLFERNPSLRRLFTEDIVVQTEKVMMALGAVLAQIHNIDACRTMTRELAVRHVNYGVVAEDYDTVGLAVQDMLALVLDDDLDDELARAWQRAYASIASAMVASAYGRDAFAA